MDLKTGRSISERLNAPLDEVLYMPINHYSGFQMRGASGNNAAI